MHFGTHLLHFIDTVSLFFLLILFCTWWIHDDFLNKQAYRNCGMCFPKTAVSTVCETRDRTMRQKAEVIEELTQSDFWGETKKRARVYCIKESKALKWGAWWAGMYERREVSEEGRHLNTGIVVPTYAEGGTTVSMELWTSGREANEHILLQKLKLDMF